MMGLFFQKVLFMKKRFLLGGSLVALAAVSPAMAAPPVLYNWTGFYVGGNIGYSWGNGAVNYNDPGFGAPPLTAPLIGANNLDGAIGGVQIGYNWQLNNSWVAGWETDFQVANEQAGRVFSDPVECEGGPNCNLSGTLNSAIDWFGTVRGRLAGSLIRRQWCMGRAASPTAE
jgi:outer membrane immunogenic protein